MAKSGQIVVNPTSFLELLDCFSKYPDVFRGSFTTEDNKECFVLSTDSMLGHLSEILEVFVTFDMKVK